MKKQFIAGGREICTIERHVPCPFFKRVFVSDTRMVKIQIACTGFYRLWLNGKEITKGMLSPYIANPDHYVYYDEYEVALETQNILCVLLGDGFNNRKDHPKWIGRISDFCAPPAFWLGVFADEKCIVQTDERFLCTDSPITFSDIRCGERYDARLERDNFFTDDFKGFRAPTLVASPKGELRHCLVPPVRICGERRAVSILASGNGYLYDFGENDAGVCRLNICGNCGQTIDLTFGEVVQDGVLDLQNIWCNGKSTAGYVQHDRYICREGEQEYTPSFTYHGFRYVSVEGITDKQATKDLLVYLPVHSDLTRSGTFRCDNEIVNKILECTVRSDISNFHYYPTDCPQREKNGWTADISLSSEQMLYLFDVASSLKEWLSNVRKAQCDDGHIPGVVPTEGFATERWNGPAWDGAIVEVPYQIYRFTGDKNILAENLPMIKKYFAYMFSKRNSDGLFAYGLGDWCEAGSLWEGDVHTPLEVTDSLTCVEMLRKAAELANAIGDVFTAADWYEKANTIVIAFLRKYRLHAGKLSVDTQTAYAMALSLKIFEGEEHAVAYKELKRIIARDGHMHIGVLGGKRLFQVLSDGGDSDLALKLITQPFFPSYGYHVLRGATTLPEMFFAYKNIPGKIERDDNGDGRILSFNHHFWGFVSAWFFETIAGLKILSATEVKVCPTFPNSISFIEASYGNLDKYVKVRWERKENRIYLKVSTKKYKIKTNHIPDHVIVEREESF